MTVAQWKQSAESADGPWRLCQAITKSNDTLYDPPIRGLYVGTEGDVTVKDLYGNSVLFKDVPQGHVLPGVFIAVMETGTDASDFVAGF